jgi:hypothetical protein
MEDAACKESNFPPPGAWWSVFDPDIFFPERGRLDDVEKAKWTCFVCPVSDNCNEYRVRSGSDYGIWAGKFKEKPEQAPEPVPLDVVVDIIHLEI